MPYLHFETLLSYDMMSETVSQVKRRTAVADLDRDPKKEFRTEVLLRDVSWEALTRYKIPFEFNTAYPERTVIPRYVPSYEMKMLRILTKRLRGDRKRSKMK